MREQNIYDDPSFFDGYQKLRQNPSAANDLVEKPALFSLIFRRKCWRSPPGRINSPTSVFCA